MKTLLLILVCSMAFGQKKKLTTGTTNHDGITVECAPCPGITVTDEVRLNQLGLDRKIDLSKGEALQQKDWEEFVKQFQIEDIMRRKYFLQRDSLHNVFLRYTVSPYINPGDSVAEFNQSQKEFTWKEFKPKKPSH